MPYLKVNAGLLGTPPGVLLLTGGLRSPSPFLVKAATCIEYLVSGCNPLTLYSNTESPITSNRIGSFSKLLPFKYIALLILDYYIFYGTKEVEKQCHMMLIYMI